MTETFMPSSSNIETVTFDHANGEMQVKFRSGGTYGYSSVPHDAFLRFQTAQSAGEYFHRNIKGRYAHDVIEEGADA